MVVTKSKTEQVAASALSCNHKSGCMEMPIAKCSEREYSRLLLPSTGKWHAASAGTGRLLLLPGLDSAFAPARPLPHPRHLLLILSFSFAPMLGCFTSWYRGLCGRHAILFFVSLIATLVGIILSWFGFFTCSKTRRWDRSIIIEIMTLLHLSVSVSVPVYCLHSFFLKLSL